VHRILGKTTWNLEIFKFILKKNFKFILKKKWKGIALNIEITTLELLTVHIDFIANKLR